MEELIKGLVQNQELDTPSKYIRRMVLGVIVDPWGLIYVTHRWRH